MKTTRRAGKPASRDWGKGRRVDTVPLLSDAELLMSPVMKDDSVCFLTVSFHIRRMRLCRETNNTSKHVREDEEEVFFPSSFKTQWNAAKKKQPSKQTIIKEKERKETGAVSIFI